MNVIIFLIIFCFIEFQVFFLKAQSDVSVNLIRSLSFETEVEDDFWEIYSNDACVFRDTIIKKKGSSSWQIQSNTSDLFLLTSKIKNTVYCDTAELRGWYKCMERNDDANWGIFLEDSYGGYALLHSDSLKSCEDWTEFRIKFPCHTGIADLEIGISISGPMTLWLDDFEILVDAESALPFLMPDYKVDRDHEFDEGSGISIDTLTSAQLGFLDLTGRIWGYLKYHHPLIASGQINWDYEFFRILPDILKCRNQRQLNNLLQKWIDKFEKVSSYQSVMLDSSLYAQLPPACNWINREKLGRNLSDALLRIRYAKRGRFSYYISFPVSMGVSPVYERENFYSSITWKDVGYRLLALFRFWNAIEYNYPYRTMTDLSWDKVLTKFIPRFIDTSNEVDYQNTLQNLITQIDDSHGALKYKGRSLTWPMGYYSQFAKLEYIQDHIVVLEPYCGALEMGDIIVNMNSVKMEDLINQKLFCFPASNSFFKKQHICRVLGCMDRDSIQLLVRRDSLELDVVLYPEDLCSRPQKLLDYKNSLSALETIYFRSELLSQALPDQLAAILKSEALIIDLRYYLPEAVGVLLATQLKRENLPFFAYAKRDPLRPGGYLWKNTFSIGDVNNKQYNGKIIVLVDFYTISSGEYNAMALRSMKNVVIIGRTTAGADGEVSYLPMPCGYEVTFTGNGVWNPDKTPCQRVGIIPDIYVNKTIEGVRQGRDEILEAAIEYIKNNKDGEKRYNN